MTKYAKNIKLPVIENIIILGFLLVNTSSKQKRTYSFKETSYIFYIVYIHGK